MGTYQIEWKSAALRELRRIDRNVIPRIVSAVEALQEDPFPPTTRKLQGTEHTYRLRVGDYRVIYEVLDKRLIIQIVRVRHRRDVYQR
ncbi:MAG TPA: type II toxin-antitoxin system RelE/ParE family toxin [Candidatus Hydrogenedentes bacterium]|nr:type II toxin-antitoxin system RelE/ParE family toxin [Candidatus Hydrogenedentota bacterium]